MARRTLSALAVCASALAQSDMTVDLTQRPQYPPSARVEQVDDYHGTKVEDPYRWLEDVDSGQTRAWVEAQNRLTFGYLRQLPGREEVRKRLTGLFDYERTVGFFKSGGRYFAFRNNGLQNQNVLFVSPTADGEGRILLDPNTLSADGTVALGNVSVSPDGKLLAYSLSRSGSDWRELRVRDIETGKDLPDVVTDAKFTDMEWSRDSRGFWYQRFQPQAKNSLVEANTSPKLKYHRLGEADANDRTAHERPDQPKWNLGAVATEDGRYLVVYEVTDTKNNLLSVVDLQAPSRKPVALTEKPGVETVFLGNRGTRFYLRTDDSASRGRIIAIDVAKPGRENWREVVPEQPETLESAQMAGNQLLLSYMKDAYSQAVVRTLEGEKVRDVALPGIGTAEFAAGRTDEPEVFFVYTSFTTPVEVHRYDMRTGESRLLRRSKLTFDPAAFETRQVFYASKDGTRVPMFLVHRKGLKLDGSHKTFLYGYGGFNIPQRPLFSVPNLAWVEMGNVYAVAGLRGGSEYGEAWHEAGTKLKKQNVFDDFITAAEWLIANKYTSSTKLAIGGGSNGGLLVGAVLNQRPELFGAALPAVGVMDMLRFHKFTIGHAWTGDYGSSDNPDEFRALRAYSPVHNIRMGTKYPAVMVTTADHDDRVVPGHSFKYAAALQRAQEGQAPVLIRIETKAGHGAGKPISKIIDEVADRWAFLAYHLK